MHWTYIDNIHPRGLDISDFEIKIFIFISNNFLDISDFEMKIFIFQFLIPIKVVSKIVKIPNMRWSEIWKAYAWNLDDFDENCGQNRQDV